MVSKFAVATFAIAALALIGLADAAQDKQEKKKRTGMVTGELKSRKDAPNKINVLVDILADGEEKARSYRVAYDPKVKGPMPEVLKAVKAAPLGSRVQIDWVEGEGYNITAFQVLKKDEKK
jgi:hypothetical protein